MAQIRQNKQVESSSSEAPPFTPRAVVGVGAIAGDLGALTSLFARIPRGTGLAMVIVLADHSSTSNVRQALAPVAHIPIVTVSDNEWVEPDHAYLVPSGMASIYENGALRLQPLSQIKQSTAVDTILYSLAEQLGARAVGVMLDCSTTDGANGLEALKREGGLTFAADPGSSPHASAPASTAAADHILDPGAIADELVRLAKHPYLTPKADQEPDDFEAFGPPILALLSQQNGVNFGDYKSATIRRRIMRRVMLGRFTSLRDYWLELSRYPEELDRLCQDLLISVTGLFRDPEVYDCLASRILPELMRCIDPGQPLRVWVPGCSKGDEAFSVAITLLEVAEAQRYRRPFQIFATDVNPKALEHARAGIYPESLATELSPDRLRRFFQPLKRVLGSFHPPEGLTVSWAYSDRMQLGVQIQPGRYDSSLLVVLHIDAQLEP